MIGSYVHGDKKRLFVNTALGCNSQCSYCYLPDLKYSIGEQSPPIVQPEKVIDSILDSKLFERGMHGTLLSIGCYSECWDALNRNSTKHLLKAFLKMGNPVQFATKRYVNYTDITPILEHQIWDGQLSIYISNASVSEWEKYERGTTHPQKRFESFTCAKKINVPIFLYLKPILQDVTINDLDYYIGLVEEWGVDAIVGDMFSPHGATEENLAPIANGKLSVARPKDSDLIAMKLSESCKVFRNSTEVIENIMTGKEIES